MKSQLIALAAAALLASVSGASLAQDANPPATTPHAAGGSGGGNSAVRTACAADFAKVCPGITDRPALRQCVMDNFASLSDGCKTAIQAMQSQMQQSGGAGH
jgi:hypothetical protein